MVESTIVQDIRYGARALRRTRSFTVTAVMALALGIGGTSAIFSVVNAILLEPLPLGDPGRIVTILQQHDNPVAPANFLDWKRQATSFERMGAAEYWTPRITGDGPAEKIQALHVTDDALAIADVQPLIGRLFLPGEDEPGREYEAVLSWQFWQRRYGGDRAILGRAIQIEGNAYIVVGVMPPRFDYPLFWAHDVQLWAPLALGARAADRGAQSLRVLARLRPGVSLAAARAEMANITSRLERAYPGTNRNVSVSSLRDIVVGDVRPALLVLLGAVGFVLLLACANIAHMLLARSAAREREVTIRAALGASRGRIVQQLVTESLLLGIAGGALGLGLAAGGIRILLALGGSGLPRANEIGVDLRVVVFTILVSITTGLTFGLMPAMRSSRAKLADSLREGTHGAGGSGRQRRLRDVLVASELALALILLTGAGLAIRTFIALRNIDPGFQPRGIVTMTVSFTGTAEGSPGAREAFVRQLLERVRALPGVRRASAVNHVPIVGDIWGLPFFIEGRPGPKPGDVPSAAYRVVLPGYFGVMGIRLLAGRDVMASDRAGAPRVVIVNEYLAHTYWPGESAIGKRIALERPGANTDWLTVIGVSKNVVRSDWSAPPAEEIYVPWLQEGHYLSGMGGEVGYVTLVVRANCGSAGACHPSALVPVLRHVIWSLDRNLAVSDVWTLDRVVEAGTSRSRFTLLLLVTFAAVALVLAAVGVYGVMSYTVSRRRHEIGVRIALGAAPGSIVSMIVREGMVVVGIGGAIGIAGAFALTRSMASLLYSITPLDPITFLTVSFILTMTALLATYVPAQSAARSDPLRALRAE